MLRRRKQRQRVLLAAITALAVLVGSALYLGGFVRDNLQSATSDTFITFAPAKVKNQITIVAIDDATIKQYGRWPLPRKAYTDLLTTLKPLIPKVIAFDVALYDPSPDAAQDAALAAAIKDSPTRNPAGNLIGGSVVLPIQGLGTSVREGGIQRFGAMQLPLPIFADAATALAVANVEVSPDSRVRQTQLAYESPEGRFYALPLVAAAFHLNADPRAIRVEDGRVVLATATTERVMPTDEFGLLSIYYSKSPAKSPAAQATPCADTEQFCVVSLADVVNGKIPRQLLANRTIFLGAHSASAVPDSYATPNSGGEKMFGVEIWANTTQSVFTNRFPVPDDGAVGTLAQVALVTVLGVWAVGRYGLRGFVGALGGLVAYGVARLIWFVAETGGDLGSGAVHVASLGAVAPSAFWWVIVLGYLLVEEQLAVTRTQSTFGRFVTPSVARTIMEREERGVLQLGGELRPMTVLFGDIRGFTTMSEGMDPPALMATLNRYFDGMVTIVTRYEGTVNKYNGDNIMVIFNAPLEVEDHARKAIECALQIQRWIVAERGKGGPDVAFGFGVNSGMASAGFLGAMGRMEYTVIGDAVNVASRLTSNDIARRDQVACSEETLRLLGDDVSYTDLGAIFVKGREEAVRCVQVDRLGEVVNPNPAPAPEIPVGKAAVAGFH